jgi:hypothetical protein
MGLAADVAQRHVEVPLAVAPRRPVGSANPPRARGTECRTPRPLHESRDFGRRKYNVLPALHGASADRQRDQDFRPCASVAATTLLTGVNSRLDKVPALPWEILCAKDWCLDNGAGCSYTTSASATSPSHPVAHFIPGRIRGGPAYLARRACSKAKPPILHASIGIRSACRFLVRRRSSPASRWQPAATLLCNPFEHPAMSPGRASSGRLRKPAEDFPAHATSGPRRCRWPGLGSQRFLT